MVKQVTKNVMRSAAATLALGIGFTTLATPANAVKNDDASPASETAATSSLAQYDLAPHFTVSSWKSPGYAGSVAIKVKNEGSDRYYGNFPIVSFKVEVKTASGPEGVDRLITPSWYSGAYVRDLGFNAETSTRTFMVTLSNPVKKGEDQLIGSLSFGDGLTSEGRLKNYIEVTQVGRIDGDTSTSNDQHVDSRTNTVTDFGNKNAGIF